MAYDLHGINPGRLYTAYFLGYRGLGLEAEEEARGCWLKHLLEDRVIGCPGRDNFWKVRRLHSHLISCFTIDLPRGSVFAVGVEGPLSVHLSSLPTFLSSVLDFLPKKAFFLYNTLSFPINLTELMAQEAGMTIDMEGFVAEMEGQKRRSREATLAARGTGGKQLELVAEQTSWLANSGIAVTDNSPNYSWAVEVDTVVRVIFMLDSFVKDGDAAKEGDAVGLILDKSSFYTKAGGQEANLSTIAFKGGGEFAVSDVQIYGGYALHLRVVYGRGVHS